MSRFTPPPSAELGPYVAAPAPASPPAPQRSRPVQEHRDRWLPTTARNVLAIGGLTVAAGLGVSYWLKKKQQDGKDALMQGLGQKIAQVGPSLWDGILDGMGWYRTKADGTRQTPSQARAETARLSGLSLEAQRTLREYEQSLRDLSYYGPPMPSKSDPIPLYRYNVKNDMYGR